MYRIIGADQKEYGPVTAAQVRDWIQAGRANADTRIQAEGSADWRPLGELPEFADALGGRAAAAPPLAVTPPKTSRLAVSSLVLGVLGVLSCGLTALVGLVLGIVALLKINRSAGRLAGNGLAIAGIVVSALFLLLMPFCAALFLPALSSARATAQTVACSNNLKELTLAAILYANDNQGRLPDAARWCDLIQTNLSSVTVLRCPAAKPAERCHYAFNARLSGVGINDLERPDQTVLFIESAGGWNVSGGVELLPKPPRHRHQVVVGFADGHVERLPTDRLEGLRWEP